eukprot:968836-Pyramimonas_sp.AAC.1
MGRIYIAGAKPALTFGGAIVGVTDAELKRARGALLFFQAPRHAGVSMRAEVALVGDPLWKGH